MPLKPPIDPVTAAGTSTITDRLDAVESIHSVIVAAPTGVAATDTAALQAALTAVAAAGGGTVYLCAGTYALNAALSGSESNVRICGAGKGATVISYSGSGTALTWGTGASTPNVQFVMEGVRIDGTSSGTAGIRFNAIQDWTLINCDVVGFSTGYGIWLDNSNTGLSLNTDVRQNEVGWRVGNFANLNTIIGGQITDNGHAIHVYSDADGNTWSGCNITASTEDFAVYLQAGRNNTIERCWFGCNATGALTASIFVGDLGDVETADFCRILNNWFTESTSPNYMVRVYRGTETLVAENVHSGTGATAFCRVDGPGGVDTMVRDNVKGTVALISDGPGVRTRASGPGFDVPTVASAATITIPPGSDVVKVSGSTTVTSITANYPGRMVTIIWAAAATFDMTDGSNLKLGANITTADADDSVALVCDGTNWHQATSVSAN